jgi:putative transposase
MTVDMAPDYSQKRRRKNYNEPGHAHELTFSCYQNYPFLSKKRTCQWLVDAITDARKKMGFDVWAWVFMPDHVHLIVHPRREIYDISIIRKQIKEPVAQNAIKWMKGNSPEWLKKIERTRGNRKEYLFWQSGGGYDRNIIDSKTLAFMMEYIHLNPVRKKLVEHSQDWKWSSAAWFYDQTDVPLIPDEIPPEWLME